MYQANSYIKQSCSWMIVTASIVPPPSLLPSTSVFIFCLPTPTWTNTHIHSNTNTSAKLRIWARTLSCMPAGGCLHSHMTQKPSLRRRGISMNQTSCSQRPLSGPGSSGAQGLVRQDVDVLWFWGSDLWPLNWDFIWITFTASLLTTMVQMFRALPQENSTDLLYSTHVFKENVNFHGLACVSLLQQECMHSVIVSVTREGIPNQFLSNLRIRPSFHVILLMSPCSFNRVWNIAWTCINWNTNTPLVYFECAAPCCILLRFCTKTVDQCLMMMSCQSQKIISMIILLNGGLCHLWWKQRQD